MTRKSALFILLAVMSITLASFVPLPTRAATLSAPATETNDANLESILNPDGTVNLSQPRSGSFEVRGWTMTTDASGTPRFARESAPRLDVGALAPAAPAVAGDEFWGGQFDEPAGVSGSSPVVNALVVYNGDLIVAGSFTTTGSLTFTNRIAKWNPNNGWGKLGDGFNNSVNALVLSGTILYAGGNFTGLCTNTTCSTTSTMNRLAQWNGSAWSSVANGFNNTVTSLGKDASKIYIGGAFNGICDAPACASPTTANRVAMWDSSLLLAMGNGIAAPLGVDALTSIGSIVYAGGNFTNICGDATCTVGSQVRVNNIAQWNGSSWSAVSFGVDAPVKAFAVNGSTLYTGGGFGYYCGEITCTVKTRVNGIAQWNGSAWTGVGNGFSTADVRSLLFSGGVLYAGGNFGIICNDSTCSSTTPAYTTAQWNGSAWSGMAFGLNSDVRALGFYLGNVHAGGSFSVACGNSACNANTKDLDGIARFSGTAWEPIGQGVTTQIYALAVSGNTLYVGGILTNTQGVRVNRVARWDGNAWSALGNGLNDIVYALAISGTNVIAGGNFDQICGNSLCNSGNITANSIAIWNGSSWSALGLGTTSYVESVVVMSGTVYAGGQFTLLCGNLACNSGNTSVNRVAKFNGTSWTPMSFGFNGIVHALETLSGTVYAGGTFGSICGDTACSGGTLTTTNRLAQWNGSIWSAVNNGLNGTVNTLFTNNGVMYIGGGFTNICGDSVCGSGNTRANRIASWNGSSYGTFGNGVSGDVEAIAVLNNNLHVGGLFTSICGNTTCTSGNITTNNAAYWDGGNWSTMGSGLNNVAHAMAVLNGRLYAAGFFQTAGGKPNNNMAQWFKTTNIYLPLVVR